MKSIVTGSSGFIGNRLCLLLEEQGHEVIKVSRKIKSDSKKDLVCDLETSSLENKNLSDVRTIFILQDMPMISQILKIQKINITVLM